MVTLFLKLNFPSVAAKHFRTVHAVSSKLDLEVMENYIGGACIDVSS